MNTNNRLKDILIEKVNNSYWWHVPPRDSDAYKKRGKFLAPTYRQAEFYGRPNMDPEQVKISNPIFGFSEREILRRLFPLEYKNLELLDDGDYDPDWYTQRTSLDARMHNQAKRLGFDSIILLSPTGKKFLEKGLKPHSIELNLLNV